ncbi:MAG: hypothetical protein AB8D52_05540 [Gammaproteobacteria bacterium]
MSYSKKSVTFCFRGFEVSPDEVESLLGIRVRKGKRGEPIKQNVTTKLKRSYVAFDKELSDNCRLDNIIPSLLETLGGIDHLCYVRDLISPEFIDIDIVLRIKNSDEQEGGFFPYETLNEIALLRASFSFQFL